MEVTKMCYTILTVLLLQVFTTCSAPVRLMLRPNQQNQQAQQLLQQQLTSQQSQQLLQRQLLELQQLEGLQRNAFPTQLTINPIIILLQNSHTVDKKTAEQTKQEAEKTNANKGIVDEDLDSVIIEADSEDDNIKPQRVLLLPNYARLSIGDVISAIPFLPIEINVPDTIGWAYNGISSGISSIISIFGRLPFTSSGSQDVSQQTRLTSVLQQLESKKQGFAAPPLVVLPIVPQVIPIQLPIKV